MDVAPNRKALVTGGASGFGKEIAVRLRDAGAAVAVVDIDGEKARATAEQLGNGAIGIGADVRSPEQMRAAVAETTDAFGGLDTLVASAGVFTMGRIEEVSEADWDLTIDVNMKGAFTALQAAAPALRESGRRGRVVTIGSDSGRRGFPTQSVYVASKFGLIGFTESIAAELASDGVTVNCICPVYCPTSGMGQQVLGVKAELQHRSRESIVADSASRNPLGRNATEADVADATMFFVSEHASFLTGVTLDVDGGAKLGAVPGV